MSVTDPSITDAAQPDAGQGDGGSGAAPYAEWLDRIPEEVRGDVEPVFKDWDASVTRRFQEAAEYRKGWEPYDQLGIRNQSPDSLKQLIEFQQAVEQNPAGVWEWAQNYARENGLLTEPATQDQPSEDFSFLDPQQQYEKLVSDKLAPFQQQLERLTQQWEQQQQEAYQERLNQALEQEIAAVKEQHGKDLPPSVLEKFDSYLNRLGLEYAEPGANPRDVVAKAWADFQWLGNQFETAALQKKVDQPAPAEAGGQADLNPPDLGHGQDALRNAQRIALEQLRANRAA